VLAAHPRGGESHRQHEGLRAPEDHRDVFRCLGESSVIEPELARRMESFAGLRNILVHQYHRVDDALVHEHLHQDLPTIEEFERGVHRWLAARLSGA
jgi:uncharacterized protein YutE (UPF0331/DUF86 family)